MKKLVICILIVFTFSIFPTFSQWERCSKGIYRYCTIDDIAISGNNIFAGTWGSIYFSTDNGDNWTEKNSGLTNDIVNSFAKSFNNIFAGTDGGGIFLSSDYGNNWTQRNIGLTSLSIFPLTIDSNYIYAGTYGDGIYRAKLSDLITDVETEEKENKTFIISPNPVSDKLIIQQKNEFNSHYEIINLLGIKVLTGELSGEYTSLNISQLPQGMYFLRTGGITKKFVKE